MPILRMNHISITGLSDSVSGLHSAGKEVLCPPPDTRVARALTYPHEIAESLFY